jgi:hypothetical protein
MPQKSLASFFVNECGKAVAFWTPPGVQLKSHIGRGRCSAETMADFSIFIEQTTLTVSKRAGLSVWEK